MRLQYLRRLVDDGKVEVLYLEEVDVGVERSRSGAEHPHAAYHVLHLLRGAALLHAL